MTTTAPVPVMSGHCGIRRHQQCRGLYAGHPCPCDCHTEPEPEQEPEPEVLGEIAAALTDVAIAAAVQHCPTCTCGGTS